ncbi:MAG: hypothetical protein SCK28_09760, partial [Bacillota bacterium]|nr:hypothetical protein [Bacillota bacterium]
MGKLPPIMKRTHWSTNNTTRIWADNWQQLQEKILTAKYLNGQSKVDIVILVDAESWQQSLIATSLLAEPIRAAMVMFEKNQQDKVLNLLNLLKPQGIKELDEANVLAIGNAAQLTNFLVSQGFKVESIIDTEDEGLAVKVAELRTELDKEYKEIILVDSKADAAYALPVSTWSVHKG